MPTVKQLRKAAKAADLTGYSSANKAKLEKMLADAGVTVGGSKAKVSGGAEATKGQKMDRIGVPTEPAKAGLSDDDFDALVESAKATGGESVDPKIGHPTEPKRGGVTDADIQVLTGDEVEQPKGPKPGPAPSITGADIDSGVGVPTEAKRGGLNKLERKLQGAR